MIDRTTIEHPCKCHRVEIIVILSSAFLLEFITKISNIKERSHESIRIRGGIPKIDETFKARIKARQCVAKLWIAHVIIGFIDLKLTRFTIIRLRQGVALMLKDLLKISLDYTEAKNLLIVTIEN